MGIAYNEFEFLVQAYSKGILPKGGRILEIGEARSFVKLADVTGNPHLSVSKEKSDALFTAALAYRDSIKDHPRHFELMGFFVAKQIYQVLFEYSGITSFDYSGSDDAVKVDLNVPVALDGTYDVCINCGTTEHIFNQYQAFKTIHDATAEGGVMIHWQPAHGFNHVNHGFYLVQPGLFFDLAHANRYAVKFAALANDKKVMPIDDPWISGADLRAELGETDNYILVVLQKTTNEEFKTPQQYQSKFENKDLAASWEKLQLSMT